jgi:hypothetical protein
MPGPWSAETGCTGRPGNGGRSWHRVIKARAGRIVVGLPIFNCWCLSLLPGAATCWVWHGCAARPCGSRPALHRLGSVPVAGSLPTAACS